MPGVANPSGLTVRYGTEAAGFTFPVSIEPVKITNTPVYDSAERAVVGIKYTVNIVCVVYPLGDATNITLQMGALRRLLSKPACELHVVGTGFGSLLVNRQGGNLFDMQWGPKPRVIECTQLGDNKAWRIAWQCETIVPEECVGVTRPGSGRVFEWCYTIRWDVDDKGLTRRTVTGHVRIPLTRRRPDDVTVPGSADELRDEVKRMTLIPGFRRIQGPSTLSEDRRTLDYTVTDQQLENAYAPPPGIVLVNARHDFATASMNWFKHTCSLSATYTASRDVPKSVAWEHFLQLYQARRVATVGDFARRNARHKIIPLTLSGGESLYDQTSTFTVRYAVFAPRDFTDQLAQETGRTVNQFNLQRQGYVATIPFQLGFWTAPPQSDWLPWAQSMTPGVWHPRGHAKLAFDPRDDTLATICQPVGTPLGGRINNRGGDDKKSNNNGGDPNGRRRPGRSPLPRGGGPLPDSDLPPEDSWLEYRLRVRIIQNDETVPLKLLPGGGAVDDAVPRRRTQSIDDVGGFTADYSPSSSPPNVIQHRAQPTFLAVMEGFAVRAGYSIDAPSVLDVGGVKAIPYNADGDDFFVVETSANLLTPVAAASFRQTYLLESTPTQAVKAPDNPFYGKQGGSQGDGLTGYTLATG